MKLINSYYIPETGESQVTLANRYGQYTGMAFVHPEDKNTASQFTGCRFAERRAYIKSFEDKIRRYKIQRKALESFEKDLNNVLESVPPEVTHRIKVHLNRYNEDIDNAETLIKIFKYQEKEDIKLRDEILQRAKEKQETS